MLEAEPGQNVADTNAKPPGFFFGYLIPKSRTPEHYALEVATALLGDGDSSRLERLLVRERAVAQQVSAGTYDNVGPDMLLISAVLTENAKLAAVEKLIEDELLKLAKTPPPAAELDKVKRRIRSSFVFGLQTNLSRATKLGEYESYFGDARLLARELHGFVAVEVARDREHGVLGSVVRVVEGLDPLELGAVEVLHAADGRVRVRRVVGEHQLA